MSIDDDRRKGAYTILFDDGLSDYIDKMDGNSADFVNDMVERFGKWKDATFVSEGQLKWLESLAERYL